MPWNICIYIYIIHTYEHVSSILRCALRSGKRDTAWIARVSAVHKLDNGIGLKYYARVVCWTACRVRHQWYIIRGQSCCRVQMLNYLNNRVDEYPSTRTNTVSRTLLLYMTREERLWAHKPRYYNDMYIVQIPCTGKRHERLCILPKRLFRNIIHINTASSTHSLALLIK